MKTLAVLLILAGAALLVGLAPPGVTTGADLTATGSVTDLAKKPIFGAEVAIIRNGQIIAVVTTGEDGKYAAQFPAGDPIAIRFIKNPDYPAVLVAQLSGNDPQQISEVLYRSKELAEAPKQAQMVVETTKVYLKSIDLDSEKEFKTNGKWKEGIGRPGFEKLNNGRDRGGGGG